ncbi:MAG TPA: class I SAM-dependent methyltransferase [Syntrophales bacterium]|nr:class I SAM-dependent methyltransferase [Syntrophales bacterium]
MRVNIFGRGMDRMPDLAFRIIALMFKIRDIFIQKDKLLDKFGIRQGQSVVDYGCGPGSYIRKASELVGTGGRVYAIDIHELAIESVKKRISKENLHNVTALAASKERCPLNDDSIDLIYALDMFHMVANPTIFLKELNRISKPDGILFIDNGHQNRDKAKTKINSSGTWEITEERQRYMKCRPIKKNMTNKRTQ